MNDWIGRIGGLLGPSGLSPDDQRKLGAQSLLAAGLGILGGRGPQALGQGLLGGVLYGQQQGQQMWADAQKQQEMQRQQQMRALAQQYAGKGTNGGFDYGGYTQALAALDPEGAAKLGEYLSKQKLTDAQTNKIENPQTTDITEYEYAKQNGFTGSFADWQKQQLSGRQSIPAEIQMYQLAQQQGYKGTFEQWMRDKANLRTYGIAGLTPEQNDALFGPSGAVPTGKLDPAKITSRTARLYADAYLANPDVNMNRLSADAALQRNPTFQQRTMALESLPEVMQTMTDLGKKVGYSDVRAVGKMQAWLNGQLNDPDWQKYMTVRNDALMTIASVMRGVGMSDKAHEAEIEAASPTMSPRALDAWLQAQMSALEPRLKRAENVKHLGETPKPQSAPKVVDWSQLQ
jgi:hypothetical protein